VNRGQMGYISRDAICPKALEMLHLRSASLRTSLASVRGSGGGRKDFPD
jgi:hypothetical protein